MAHNDFPGVTIPDQQFPPANAPVWVVPSNAARNSIVPVLAPGGTDVPQPSAPDQTELPPTYFDISSVPSNAILHYSEVVPYSAPSQALVTRKGDGVLTLDPLLNANPDQVWLYFMTYLNERPSLKMNIHGYHTERYTTQERTSTGNGNYTTRTVHRTRSVTDFNFSVDLSEYVCQQWWRVSVIPSNEAIKKGEIVSLRDAIEQYTRSEKSVKEIVCNKQVQGWNFGALACKIGCLIRSTGYHNQISVVFGVEKNRIAARSSSKLSRFSNSLLVRSLCVVSCLCLIFGPIYLCLKALGSTRDRIVADYKIISNEETFFRLNAAMIANAAGSRSRENYRALLA